MYNNSLSMHLLKSSLLKVIFLYFDRIYVILQMFSLFFEIQSIDNSKIRVK